MYSKPTGIVAISTPKVIHEGVSLPIDYIVQPCPFYILLGVPSCGKSTTISEMLRNSALYFKKFNKVLFITPSGFSDLDLVLDENWYPSLNIEWLYGKIKENCGKDTIQQVLVVFDDCVAEMNKLNSNPLFTQLFFNRRHLMKGVCVSILLTTQYWTKIPASIRALNTGLFIFKCAPTELEKLIKEVNIGISPKAVLQVVTEKVHNFMYVNFINNKKYLNFDSELII